MAPDGGAAGGYAQPHVFGMAAKEPKTALAWRSWRSRLSTTEE